MIEATEKNKNTERTLAQQLTMVEDKCKLKSLKEWREKKSWGEDKWICNMWYRENLVTKSRKFTVYGINNESTKCDT